MGLTATLERSDDGVEEKLLPFFGESIVGCDYRRARADKIIAPIRVMTVAVQFSALEFNRNQRLEDELRRERRSLIDNYGCSESSFGVFFRQVQDLAKNGDFRAARTAGRYLHAFSARRELLATCRAKLKAIEKLGAVLAGAGKTLVFSETKESARGCADALASAGVYAESMSSDDVGAERTRLLRQFDEGRITALAAPRILDEGIDVPEADVGIIAAASSSRRQMVQRIGRVIRVKPDGRPASFVILYMQSSIEDPARGAHESFLEQLLEIADEKLDVPADGAAVQLANWLGQSMETVESARSMPRLHALSAVVNGKDVIDPVRAGSVTNVLLHEAIRADPDRFDLLLSCLAILSPQQIRVIVTRFGLGGGPRRSVRETAQLLRIGARDVVRVEDESLGRLEGQDVLPIIQLLCGEA
ncbi:DNA repair helicase [Gordonia neofelifaecis NRRL B-59395]|uniref:DNA repair helicase n=1 Tax=Gordonia neofelifaecis NRRL B-59395 TaxID=644548 RepID=F1YDZ6_9ACTN|nr:DNA repair helicase [Gordonia neofelifaecis NRRL B-59395]